MDGLSPPDGEPRWAWFLDLDGTLIEIAPRPDAVSVSARTLATVHSLVRATGGAVALISGRNIDVLDRLFSPLRLPCAGVHGLERRDSGGRLHRVSGPSPALEVVRAEFAAFAATHPGVLIEDKGVSVALHFRKAPRAADAAVALGRDIAQRFREALVLQPGKMVIELRMPGADKGLAIAAFMRELPFDGRVPVFVGDDASDEAGFVEVNRRGGHSIRIGDGTAPTGAIWRVPSVAALLDWLESVTAPIAR
jgi:trehalose 6-phosphate phosphatase